jgi:hypothetical protein
MRDGQIQGEHKILKDSEQNWAARQNGACCDTLQYLCAAHQMQLRQIPGH